MYTALNCEAALSAQGSYLVSMTTNLQIYRSQRRTSTCGISSRAHQEHEGCPLGDFYKRHSTSPGGKNATRSTLYQIWLNCIIPAGQKKKARENVEQNLSESLHEEIVKKEEPNNL